MVLRLGACGCVCIISTALTVKVNMCEMVPTVGTGVWMLASRQGNVSVRIDCIVYL